MGLLVSCSALQYHDHILASQENALTVKYSPKLTTQCCIRRCKSDKGCQDGCMLWLHHSSLNWEATKFHKLLEQRCEHNCGQKSSWNRKDKGEGDHQSYWDLQPTVKNERACKQGCLKYYFCM